ncbi:MAG TPA: biopolymer transporter ExbD [bacterium]|nr:biopolymer transporter ExbD [bacterium]
MPSRRKKKVTALRNVNLVPLLDFIVAVIPVLLLSVSFTEYVILDASLPVFADDTNIVQQEGQEQKKLGLTVAITDDGFVVGGTGGILTVDGSGTLIKKNNGKYDYDLLNKKLAEIKSNYPEEWSIIIVPQSDTKFQDIIMTMDASREKIDIDGKGIIKKKTMFPNVVLGGGVL